MEPVSSGPRARPPLDQQAAGKHLPAEPVLRSLLGGVAFAAGLTGLALLAFPGSTPRYFSWGLSPAPLASLIGGSYVASMLVFGFALGATWQEVRGLAAGTLALTLPILAVTFIHLEAFDFARWQAWAWIILFIASPLAFGTVLLLRRRSFGIEGARLPALTRALAAVLALVFLAMAMALWWDPGRTSHLLPFDLPPLGGRVLGCWLSFLAFLAAWVAVRGRANEGRVLTLGLAAFVAGALVGAVRNLGDLQPPARRLGYLVTLVGQLLLASLLALQFRREPEPTSRARSPNA